MYNCTYWLWPLKKQLAFGAFYNTVSNAVFQPTYGFVVIEPFFIISHAVFDLQDEKRANDGLYKYIFIFFVLDYIKYPVSHTDFLVYLIICS